MEVNAIGEMGEGRERGAFTAGYDTFKGIESSSLRQLVACIH